jgi:hypothetical protein
MEKTARAIGMANAKKKAAEAVQRELGKMSPKTDELSAFSNLNPDQRERIKRNLEEKGIQPNRDNITRYYISMLRQGQADLDKAWEMQNLQCNLDREWKKQMIYSILTDPEMKRALPKDQRGITDLIEKGVTEGSMSIVCMWGGFKESESRHADDADEAALSRIKQSVDAVKEIGVQMDVLLVFSDNTARNSSLGRSKDRGTDAYYEDITEIADRFGFETMKFSDMMPEFSMSNISNFIELSNKTNRVLKSIGKNVADRFMAAAMKHTDISPSEGKKIIRSFRNYMSYRISESFFLENHFSKSLFIAYGYPYERIWPTNTLFWYSIKKGVSTQPWFIDGSKFDISTCFNGQSKESSLYDIFYYDLLERLDKKERRKEWMQSQLFLVGAVAAAFVVTATLASIFDSPQEKMEMRARNKLLRYDCAATIELMKQNSLVERDLQAKLQGLQRKLPAVRGRSDKELQATLDQIKEQADFINEHRKNTLTMLQKRLKEKETVYIRPALPNEVNE